MSRVETDADAIDWQAIRCRRGHDVSKVLEDEPMPSPVPDAFSRTSIGIALLLVIGFGSSPSAVSNARPFRPPGADALVATEAAVRPDVHHHEPRAVLGADRQLVGHRLDRLLPEVFVGAGQIDRDTGRGRRCGRCPAASRRERNSASAWAAAATPAPRGWVVGEDLDRRGADLLARFGGFEHSLAERQVRADESAVVPTSARC